MINLIKKYKSLILYVVFGGFTTLINILIYYVCARLLHMATIPSNIIAWVVAVLFAYITNRRWVFDSKSNTIKGIIVEVSTFAGCRLLTGGIDVGVMYVFVDICGFNDMIVKVLSNIIVIVLNYVASKLVIFKG